MDHVREKAALLRAIGVHRQTTKSQLSLQLIGFDSPALIYLQLTKTNYEILKLFTMEENLNNLTANIY